MGGPFSVQGNLSPRKKPGSFRSRHGDIDNGKALMYIEKVPHWECLLGQLEPSGLRPMLAAPAAHLSPWGIGPRRSCALRGFTFFGNIELSGPQDPLERAAAGFSPLARGRFGRTLQPTKRQWERPSVTIDGLPRYTEPAPLREMRCAHSRQKDRVPCWVPGLVFYSLPLCGMMILNRRRSSASFSAMSS